MAEEPEKHSFNWRPLLRNLLTLAVMILAGYLLFKLGIVSLFILFGVILSLVARPLYNQLAKIKIGKFKMPGALNAIICIFVVWGILGGIGAAIVPIIGKEVNAISKVDPEKVLVQLQDPINKGIHQLEKYGVLNFTDTSVIAPEKVIEKTIVYKMPCDSSFANCDSNNAIIDTIVTEQTILPIVSGNNSDSLSGIYHRKELESRIVSVWKDYFNYGKLKKWFGSIFSLLGNILAIIASASFLAFFFLRDQNLFMKMVLALIPERFEEKTKAVYSESRKMLSRYFIGLMLELLLVMVCTTIGMLIVGIRFDLAITIGFFCGLFNIVPYLGPIIGGALGLILGITNYLEMDFYAVILPLFIKMAIVFWIVQLLDNNLFQTIIFSNTVNAHPIEIFMVIVTAGTLWGITGMILAIPVYTFIRIIARQFFSNFKVVRSLTKNM